ncbi:MAG TPA: hypothetical protein VL551_31565 [Actinospica sp.]|jgi:hypothetical protein|nr:hypothetical protein [Actinospica sp.]
MRDSGVDPEPQLVEEFRRLRRGRGLRAAGLAGRLGPLLTELVDAPAGTSDRELRRRLLVLLEQLTRGFPSEQRDTIMSALAADAEGNGVRRGVRLSDRTALLAEESHYAERTVRRRIQEAFGQLVAAAAAELSGRDREGGWYLRRLESLLRLDGEGPEVSEKRTIVARRDGLERIRTKFSVPANGNAVIPEPDLLVSARYGAVITKTERRSDALFEFEIEFPEPIPFGREHEYELVFRLPPQWPLQPYYAMVPMVECDAFRLRVRFGLDRLPASVVLLDGIEYQEFRGRLAPGRPVRLDSFGEAALSFERLTPRLMYGIEWVPAAGQAAA